MENLWASTEGSATWMKAVVQEEHEPFASKLAKRKPGSTLFGDDTRANGGPPSLQEGGAGEPGAS